MIAEGKVKLDYGAYCIEDIQFGGLVAKYHNSCELEHGGWAVMTAKVEKEFNKMYYYQEMRIC